MEADKVLKPKGLHRMSTGYFMVFQDTATSASKRVQAHRLIFEECFGPIPEGKVVMHKCDNPGCVNPEHLQLGTQLDNIRDCHRKRRDALSTGNHNTATLTKDQVREIRSTKMVYGMRNALAKRFGVSVQQIYRVRRGQSWRHL